MMKAFLLIGLIFSQLAFAAPTGIALVGHGLNNSPASMEQITGLLNSWGIAVVPIELAGHLGNDPDSPMPVVRAAEWQENFAQAYQAASLSVKRAKVPFYFVGFSLSTVVTLAALQNPEYHFDKMILLAPPLIVNAQSRAVKILPANGTNIPSMMPRELRAHKGTSTAAYHALFETMDEVKLTPALAATPTLVVIDAKDELVDARKTVERIKQEAPRWIVRTITVEKPGGYGFHHLLIDEKCVGQQTWAAMTNAMKAFLLP